jgi:hypothetical protein
MLDDIFILILGKSICESDVIISGSAIVFFFYSSRADGGTKCAGDSMALVLSIPALLRNVPLVIWLSSSLSSEKFLF